MKFKNIFLVSLILLAIITLGTVSAEDINETLTVNDYSEDSVVESINDDLSSVSEDADLSAQLKDADVDIESPSEVKACQNNEIYVTLPDDATGTVASYFDGEEDDEIDLVDGYAEIPFKFDSFGLHDVSLVYSGDANYAGKLIWSHTYNVTDFVMGVTYPEDIYYGHESTIYVDLPEEVEGKLELKLNDNFYHSVSSFKGDFEFPIYNLKLGENKFTINYYGGNRHDVTVKGTFLAIPVIDIPYKAYYNQDYNVSLILPSDAKGSLVVDFNGRTYTSKMNNGKASVSLPTNLDLGYYEITARYDGSDYDVESGYYVVQLAPCVSFSKYMWIEDTNSIVLEGPKSMKGTLKIKIDDGATKTVKITDGKATIPLTGLSAGGHYFFLIYNENDYSYSDSKEFEVKDVNPNINLALDFINETRVNEPFDISTNIPTDGDGILYVYVDGELAQNYVSWGYANYACIDPSNLEVGKHTVKLQYCNDSYYRDASKSASFYVVDVKILIPKSIVYDEGNACVEVDITENVTGNITVYIDGKKYKKTPITPAYYGKDAYGYSYIIDLGRLDMGTHKINVKYSGDGTYASKSRTVNANVSYSIGLDEGDFAYGSGRIFVELPFDATGNITAKIDGKSFKKIVYFTEDGCRYIYLDISQVNAGTHTVEVTYPGDERYYPLTATGKFNVSYQCEFGIFEEYGKGNTYVSLKLPKDANGHLRALLDNKTWFDLPLQNGFANITFGYLKVGEHKISAYYTGEDYYTDPNGYEESFEIIPYLKYEEPKLNKAGYVYLELPSDARGNLILFMNGEQYKQAKVSKGKANITVELNDYSGYELEVLYDGSDYGFSKYFYSYVPFSIEEIPLYKGDNMSVTLPSDFTGKASITINGKTYSPKLVNGYATFTPNNLKIGENYIFTNYYGGNYENYGDEWTFTVKPKVSVSGEKVTVGPYYIAMGRPLTTATSSDYLIIDLAEKSNGEYTVVIDDDFYAKGSFVNGIANISLSKVKLGIHEIYVDYEYQKGMHDSIYFYANVKQTPKISISAKDIYVGENLAVSVSAPSDATGKVVLNVNNKNYALKLVDGKATKSISKLAAGNYAISVTYSGDDRYVANSAGATVKVLPKVKPDLTVDVSDITEGQNATVKISANNEINENVVVSINNKNYNVALVKGKVSLPVAGLAPGKYDVSVAFGGNVKFIAQNASGTFTVKAIPAISIGAKNIYIGKTLVVNISAPSDATGKVVLNVNNKNYSLNLVDGKASKSISNLPAGNYSISVSYAGDDRYIGADASATVKVKEYVPKITAKAASVLYTAKYSVTVHGKDGKVAKGVKVNFYINNKLVKKNVVTTKNGVASFTVPAKYAPNKKYTIKATALGKSVSKRVTVKQIITVKTTKFKKSAKKVIVTATLKKVNGKYIKGKTLKLRFNGKTYNAKTSKKGVAKFTIKKAALKKLKVGAKYIYKVTYSKAFVKKTVKVKR